MLTYDIIQPLAVDLTHDLTSDVYDEEEAETTNVTIQGEEITIGGETVTIQGT